MNWAEEYLSQIRAGKIIVGKKIIKEYKKLENEAANKDLPYFFDEVVGERPIQFVEEFCKQAEGKLGEPITLMLWQKAFLQTLFGWINKSDGSRRFREALLEVGRKNGKTCLCAALSLYMMIADNEGAAECYSVATKRDQAAKCFNYAVHMRQQSPEIRALVHKRRSDMYMPLTFSTFEPLASDSNSLDGLNSHFIVIDELHAIKDRNLYDVMKQSTSSRKQPLLLMITTAGTVRENIFDDMYSYADKVLNELDGYKDDTFLPILYELDSREEWTDSDMWVKANPGIGVIKKHKYLADMVSRAQADDKTRPTVLTKDFNIRETVAGSWLSFDDINNEDTYTMDDLRGCYAIGGCDLSATTDLTCATLTIMKAGGNKKYVIQMYFIPEELIDKRVKEDKIPYDVWAKEKWVTTCPGNQVDYSYVTAWFNKMRDKYEIIPLWIYYDRALAGYWVQEMESNGYNMVKCAQGAMTFSQPMRSMEADLKSKLINYNNNPVLKWCLANTSIKPDDNGNIRPVKGRNRRMRVDGTFSLLDSYVGLSEKLEDYKALI
jgi:phage terminase large subunit-like protein